MEEKIKKEKSEDISKKVKEELNGEQGVKFCNWYENDYGVHSFSYYEYKKDDLMKVDSFDAERFLGAFASAERIEIVKLLLKRKYTGNELMKELKFATTGKLYHHLNFLINVGIVVNRDGFYCLQAYTVGLVDALLMTVYAFSGKNI